MTLISFKKDIDNTNQQESQGSIDLYEADSLTINNFVSLKQAKFGDNWIEEFKITKQLLPNHLGKLVPRLSLELNGIPFRLQQTNSSDGKHLGLDAFFCAHDAFQHGWSAGFGFINNPATIGGEEATGGVQRYGLKGSSHACPLTDIPTDAIQQLGRLHEQAASSEKAIDAYSRDGNIYTMIDLWAASNLGKALGEDSIPNGSSLKIRIGRPWPDRYFVVDPAYHSRTDKPDQFTEYHSAVKILVDYRALKDGEKILEQLLEKNIKPSEVVELDEKIETTYRLEVANHKNFRQLIIAVQNLDDVETKPRLKEVLYERQTNFKPEILTPREFDLIVRQIPCEEIAFDRTRSLVIYSPENEFNTAYIFLKEMGDERVQKLQKSRFRHDFYIPLIDKPTGKPYQKSQILDISLTLPGALKSSQIKTEEIMLNSQHFVNVFNQVEQVMEELLAGKIKALHQVGNGKSKDPRRKSYAQIYDNFVNSKDPFDYFLFQTLGLTFPTAKQLHLTPALLPPQI